MRTYLSVSIKKQFVNLAILVIQDTNTNLTTRGRVKNGSQTMYVLQYYNLWSLSDLGVSGIG